jgi:hypothetical protein
MDALALLAEAQAAGLRLEVAGESLVVRGPKSAEPIVHRLREQKPAVLALLRSRAASPADEKPGPPLSAYREVLRRWWALTAQGAEADAVEVRHVYQEIVRLIDEVGEPRATERRRAWAREWHRETGRCPSCGEPGTYHDPESPRHG